MFWWWTLKLRAQHQEFLSHSPLPFKQSHRAAYISNRNSECTLYRALPGGLLCGLNWIKSSLVLHPVILLLWPFRPLQGGLMLMLPLKRLAQSDAIVGIDLHALTGPRQCHVCQSGISQVARRDPRRRSVIRGHR